MTDAIKKKRGRPAKDKAIVKTAERIIEKNASLEKEIEKVTPVIHGPTPQSLQETAVIISSYVNNLYSKNNQEYNLKKNNFLTSIATMPQEEGVLNGWFRYIELESAKVILATILANAEARKILIDCGMFNAA